MSAAELPQPMGRYRHWKGGHYHLLAIGLMTSGLRGEIVPYAIYRAEIDGTIWTRPADEFFGRVDGGAGRVPRFAPAPGSEL